MLRGQRVDLRDKYSRLRHSFQSQLAVGGHKVGTLPHDDDAGWGVSLVIRLTDALGEGLSEAAETLSNAASGEVFVYNAAELHITVRSLEGYRSERLSTSRCHELSHYVEQSIACVRPFEIGMNGLAGGGDTLFACGYADPELSMMRSQLHRRRHDVAGGGSLSPDSERIRDTAHASLLIFRGSSRAEVALSQLLHQFADTHFGSQRVNEVDLVEYSPDAESIGMTVLRTFHLS